MIIQLSVQKISERNTCKCDYRKGRSHCQTEVQIVCDPCQRLPGKNFIWVQHCWKNKDNIPQVNEYISILLEHSLKACAGLAIFGSQWCSCLRCVLIDDVFLLGAQNVLDISLWWSPNRSISVHNQVIATLKARIASLIIAISVPREAEVEVVNPDATT